MGNFLNSKQDQKHIEQQIEKKIEQEIQKKIVNNQKLTLKEKDIRHKIKEDSIVWCPIQDKSTCEPVLNSQKPEDCYGYINKKNCEQNILKKVVEKEPKAWCPNENKTNCIEFSINNKPEDCFGDFSKEQCESSRLKKVVKQNLPVVNTLVTQKKKTEKYKFKQ